MAITESAARRRVIRGADHAESGHHAFAAVADLPRIRVGRPSGADTADPLRAAAWDEAYNVGLDQGRDAGYAEGVEAGRADGLRAGHAEGLAAGRSEATIEVQAMVSPALTALDQAVADLARRETVAIADIESVVVDLALELAAAVLEREVTVAENPGREALARALALAPDHHDVVVRLNPADLEVIGEVSEMRPGRDLILASDPSVGRGGCLLEAGAATVDARIEAGLDRAREVLQP